LAAGQGSTPAERRAWRDGVYEVIQAMICSPAASELTIERMLRARGREPGRDYAIAARLGAAARKRTGVRGRHSALWRWPIRTTAIVGSRASWRREGFAVNHKKVLLRLIARGSICCA